MDQCEPTEANIRILITGALKLVKGLRSAGILINKPFLRFLQISPGEMFFPDISKMDSKKA
jgi:hypothetical protein